MIICSILSRIVWGIKVQNISLNTFDECIGILTLIRKATEFSL